MKTIKWLVPVLLVYLYLFLDRIEARKDARIEQAAEQRAQTIHRVNTLILLTFVALLVLIVLTSWFFKHHRFQFVHETGLTLFYGLLIGFVFRYTSIGVIQSQTIDVVPKNGVPVSEPPDYLRLEVSSSSATHVQFHYELIEGFFGDKKKQEEHHLEQKAVFSPEIFFNMLLPPVIFNAGYSLKKRNFFRNIGSILAFVFLGTTISSLVTAMLMFVFCKLFLLSFSFKELFFFGAILSATDPVTVLAVFQEVQVEPNLFALIFGESALNDAVAIVLSSSIDSFASSLDFDLNAILSSILDFFTIFLGSLLLGCSFGCINALVSKMTEISEYPLLESALFTLLSYLSFLVAEFVELTGIVSVLFCGICQAHYTFNNLAPESQSRTKQFFQIISFLSESFIFCYIGVSVFISNSGKWNFFFIVASLASIVAGRAVYVYPVCALLNLRRKPKIPRNYQHMILFSGLRGAMAFALAYRNTSTDNRQIMASTTTMIVILTVFVNGGLTNWMIDWLKIPCGADAIDESRSQIISDDVQGPSGEAASSRTRISGQNPWDKAFLPRKWYNFDACFMKPLLTHATPTLLETMPSCCAPIAKFFTSGKQLNMYTSNEDLNRKEESTRITENPLARSMDDHSVNDSVPPK